jgi:hypothetical protein
MTQTSRDVAVQHSAEIENLRAAARQDAGFERILKFRKGEYSIAEEPVALGAEYLAHTTAWTKSWIKFVDGEVAERKMFRVSLGEKPPEREDLDDLDLIGKKDSDGMSADPWVFQHLLPLEDMASGEIVVFCTSSFGGRRAIADLCSTYAKRSGKTGCGQPIIRLATAEMPTKKFGKVPRPLFEIVRWDQGDEEVISPADPRPTFRDELNDEIPEFG